MKLPVSVIVLTHNSEETIERCLRSVSWSDDICVIDDDSTDRTVTLAAGEAVRILQNKLHDNFALQRNFALDQAKNDWVFFVDADEEVSEELVKEIENSLSDSTYIAYRIPRRNIYFGKELRFGEFFRFSLLRLGRKNGGKWSGAIHETWDVKGPVGALLSPLLHHQIGGVQELLKKINFYSSIRARELRDSRKRSSFMEILFFPIGKIVVNYFLKLGFLDGVPGLINATAMSFYTFLVRAKLWLLWHEVVKKT